MQKIEEIDGEYIITKDFKYESAKIDMVMSSNGEDKAHIITDAKFTSYDKFDPIQLPAAESNHCQERYLKERVSLLLLIRRVSFEKER